MKKGRHVVSCILCWFAAGCERSDSDLLQGYAEGEYVFVAAPLAGQLKTLGVARGAQVAPGDALFQLDDTVERAARDESARRTDQSQADLADLRKGRRPSELAALEAELAQARAAQQLSKVEFDRNQVLVPRGGASQTELDRTRAIHDRDNQRVAQLEADLVTARLGSREDQITAAEAEVRARQAAQVRAAWDHEQKRQAAPVAGLVFDTLYREGEWVEAGRPVVVLLPPANVKVRAFVPEPRLGSVQLGAEVLVRLDGVAEALRGKVTFIAPRAEYTPPVIYSRESRAKLVFLIEVRFDPAVAVRLHPGQPVDVDLAGR